MKASYKHTKIRHRLGGQDEVEMGAEKGVNTSGRGGGRRGSTDIILETKHRRWRQIQRETETETERQMERESDR